MDKIKSNVDIWEFFVDLKDQEFVKCKICQRHFKYSDSANMTNHLKKKHRGGVFENYFEIKDDCPFVQCKLCKNRVRNFPWLLRSHMRKVHKIKIKIIDASKTSKRMKTYRIVNSPIETYLDKKTIIRSVIGLIVEDNVSPLLLNSEHMKAILTPMYTELFRKESKRFILDIEKVMAQMACKMRSDFSNDLHCRLLAIKIDNDLNAAPNTLRISTQFLRDGVLQKRVLGIVDLKEDEELRGLHIANLLHKFNIDSNQIINAFWNNNKHMFNKQVKNKDYLGEIEQIRLYPEITLGNVKVEHYLGNSAHLCLLDILQNHNVFKKFLHCRNLTKFINGETKNLSTLFELNKLSMPNLDSPWKPGSTYKMMDDLNRACGLLGDLKIEKVLNCEGQFNGDMRMFIRSFCESIFYLQKLIQLLNHEELHIGDFYVQWLKCKLLTKEHFETLNAKRSSSSEESNYLPMMFSVVLMAIENTRTQLLNQDRVVACLYLDPRLTRVLNTDERLRAVNYLLKMWQHAKLYSVDTSEPNDVATQSLSGGEDMMTEFFCDDKQTLDNRSSEIFQKISQLKLLFLLVDADILPYWETRKTIDPEIYTLSNICFAIPATEILNETLYSHVYQLDEDLMLPALLKENLLYLRLNAHLLDYVLMQTGLDDNKTICQFYENPTDAKTHIGIFY